MATDGLSLIGFVDDPAIALHHLKASCVPPPGTSDAALHSAWVGAKSALGSPFPSAGMPSMHQIQPSEPHLQQLQQSPWQNQVNTLLARGATFQMVEIDPLLAFQLTIDKERSLQHCNRLSNPPSNQELMDLALPLAPPSDERHVFTQGVSQQNLSVLIRSRSLNLQIGGCIIPGAGTDFAGVVLQWNLPSVHVVELNGRRFLLNGFHRTYGARLAGAKFIPCLYWTVATADEAGIRELPSTFALPLLESSNPPTVGHFTRGSALSVRLRPVSRVIEVSWAQHHVYEE